jgi:hypothetical protein
LLVYGPFFSSSLRKIAELVPSGRLLVAYISALLLIELVRRPLVFWRFAFLVPSLILIVWISSFFHGFYAFFAFVCLWNGLRDVCKRLFVLPAFRKNADFQTLGLSS